jgi:hypothetical protein
MKMKICSVEGCNNPHQAKGYCMKHYRRLQRTGSLDKPEFTNKNKVCSVENCDKEAIKKGLCNWHYQKYLKFGDPTLNTRVTTTGKICMVENCNNNVYAKDLCQNHYSRFNRLKKSKGITIEEYLK